MPRSPYRPADAVSEQRWEFIWWGFGKAARRQRGFEADAPVHKSWRLGPAEIRIYLEARKPKAYEESDRPARRLRGPE
ncbi:MAG: hypothetical protein P8R42_19030 [Candidatus Binatia bacterium]|nr:hypothetical protein [Candidatus Binatia bacterium]